MCYLAAQALIGAPTVGYANGLHRFLSKRVPWSGCTPRRGDFGRSLVELLAACAADPTLREGRQGPMLVVAKAGAPPPMADVRAAAADAALGGALRVCEYQLGGATLGATLGGGSRGGGDDSSTIRRVPAEGCMPPPADGRSPGVDFMSGGARRLRGQAIVDISAAFGGGYIFGNVCGLGGGQDERLMVYMPEVTVLVFFLSASQVRALPHIPPQARSRHTPSFAHDWHAPLLSLFCTCTLQARTPLPPPRSRRLGRARGASLFL